MEVYDIFKSEGSRSLIVWFENAIKSIETGVSKKKSRKEITI